MGDEAIQEQIRIAFQEMYEGRGRARERGRTTGRRGRSKSPSDGSDRNVPPVKKQSFRLKFTIAGKVFSTVLDAESSVLRVFNGVLTAKYFKVITRSKKENRACIYLTITAPPLGVDLEPYIENRIHEFDSMISANSPDIQCFDPVLVTNRTNPNEDRRYSSADVLQILKTKLQYLLPNPYRLPIDIQDFATTKFVALTPFQVMRGGNPFYFKYGYQYPNLRALQGILETLSWGSINTKYYYKDITYEDRIQEITKRTYEDDTRVIDVLKEISFERESTENETFIMEHYSSSRALLYNNLCLSLSLLKAIAKEHGYTDSEINDADSKEYLFLAIHDPTSPEWQISSRRLLLTDFTPIAEGGKRKQKRKTRRQKGSSA